MNHLDYLDFEVEIGQPTGQEYPLTVLRSPAGEARATFTWPFGELALENRLKDLQIALLSSGGVRRTVLTPAEAAVQRFGAELFDLLFTGEVRNRYDVSQERVHHQEKGLRVKLRIQDPRLANLPWEFLYDARRDEYICLSQQTPLVRYLELSQTIRPLAVTPPFRILGMIASPSDLQALDVQVERQRLERAVAPLQDKGLVQLHWLTGATWRDLQRILRREPWHIFHFVGHGSFDPRRDEGLIAFCNDVDKAHLLTAGDLGRLLADHRTLRLAVLNACLGAQGSNRDLFASTAATLVRRGILAVVAMQQAITDAAAIEFTQTFYESLADGLPVDAAMSEARKAISFALTNTVEWGTPVLYSRASDGHLFKLVSVEREFLQYEVTRGETPETTPSVAIVEDLPSFGAKSKETEQGKGKYAPLFTWLLTRPATETHLRLSFDQVEQLIGETLPDSARTHRAWWANDSVGHTHARSWLNAGWRVTDFALADGYVTFKRANDTQYQVFFTNVLAGLRNLRPDLGGARTAGPRNYLSFRTGVKGFRFGWAFTRSSHFHIELYCDTGVKKINEQVFEELKRHQSAIEARLATSLSWERLDHRRACRIAWERPGTISDPPHKLEQLKQWAVTSMPLFVDTFQPYLKDLQPRIQALNISQHSE